MKTIGRASTSKKPTTSLQRKAVIDARHKDRRAASLKKKVAMLRGK